MLLVKMVLDAANAIDGYNYDGILVKRDNWKLPKSELNGRRRDYANEALKKRRNKKR